jgi:hypothetical protein
VHHIDRNQKRAGCKKKPSRKAGLNFDENIRLIKIDQDRFLDLLMLIDYECFYLQPVTVNVTPV